MSLVNTLLNGGTYENDVTVESAKYSHSDGASRIAMESVAELHDIFMESFYNTNQAELAAATEGVALEGSQYEAVTEAAISNAITKVKEFLKKLWAKVKAFFHNVRRYLDAIFMSGQDFVKKYKKEIDKATGLKDFSYKMFNYNNAVIGVMSDAPSTDEVIAEINDRMTKIGSIADRVRDHADYNTGKLSDDGISKLDSAVNIEDLRKKFDTEAVAKAAVINISDGKCKDPDEFDKWLYAWYRNGAESSTDKEDVDVTELPSWANWISKSKDLLSVLDKTQSRSDAAYKKAVKLAEDAEKKYASKDSKVAGKQAELMRLLSSAISTDQTYHNKQLNAWKTVVKERDVAYKQLIVAGLSHYAKQQKNKSK